MPKTVHIIGAGISGLSSAVRLRNAGLRVRTGTLLTAVHERDDARDVRLIREQLQVVEQVRVQVEAVRNPRRPRHIGYLSLRVTVSWIRSTQFDAGRWTVTVLRIAETFRTMKEVSR